MINIEHVQHRKEKTCNQVFLVGLRGWRADGSDLHVVHQQQQAAPRGRAASAAQQLARRLRAVLGAERVLEAGDDAAQRAVPRRPGNHRLDINGAYDYMELCRGTIDLKNIYVKPNL